MIKNQWYAVLDSKELPKEKPVGVTRMGENLVIWRDKKGKISCMKDRCCHRGAALSAGKIAGDQHEFIECPFHGFQYGHTGKCSLIPAHGKNAPVDERYKVTAYPAREVHGLIWIWWGKIRESYPEIPFFEDLSEGFSYYTVPDLWKTHYSRAIENQLDVIHLPFVHRNTIGRGNLTLVNGPVCKWDPENNLLNVWVFNEKDDGKKKPLKPQEIPEPAGEALVHFKFPNIWMLRTGNNMRIFVAFAPVDETSTVLYLRMYHKGMTSIPVVKNLFNWLSKRLNTVILHQDRRVVTTQEPKPSSLHSDEKLVQGDLPIVMYRRHRQELMDSNSV